MLLQIQTQIDSHLWRFLLSPHFAQIPLPAITIIYQPLSLLTHLQLIFTFSNAIYRVSYFLSISISAFCSHFNPNQFFIYGGSYCLHFLFKSTPTTYLWVSTLPWQTTQQLKYNFICITDSKSAMLMMMLCRIG